MHFNGKAQHGVSGSMARGFGPRVTFLVRCCPCCAAAPAVLLPLLPLPRYCRYCPCCPAADLPPTLQVNWWKSIPSEPNCARIKDEQVKRKRLKFLGAEQVAKYMANVHKDPSHCAACDLLK